METVPRRILSVDIGSKNTGVCGLVGTKLALWEVAPLEAPTVAGVSAFFRDVTARFPPDLVVLERQMRSNTVATRLEAMIEMFFHCRGIPVTLCAPTVKLRNALLMGYATMDEIMEAKTSYVKRKRLAVTAAGRWLETSGATSDWKTVFDSHAKKDDLADAILQGIVYV